MNFGSLSGPAQESRRWGLGVCLLASVVAASAPSRVVAEKVPTGVVSDPAGDGDSEGVVAPETVPPTPTSAGALPAADLPSTAVVTADRLRLRTGPSVNYHSYAELRENDGVVVVEARGAWQRIIVPQWFPLFVHGDYVREDSGRESGLETVPGTRARAARGTVSASRLIVRVGPELKHEAAGILASGTVVSIRERHGEWLAIAPQPTTYAWVHGDYLKTGRRLAEHEVASVWRAAQGSSSGRTVAGSRLSSGAEETPNAAISRDGVRGQVARDRRADRRFARAGSAEELRNYESEKRALRRRIGKLEARTDSQSRADVQRARKGLESIERLERRDRLIRRARVLIEQEKPTNRAQAYYGADSRRTITERPTTNSNQKINRQDFRTRQGKHNCNNSIRTNGNDNVHEHSITQAKSPRFEREREGVDHDGTIHARGSGTVTDRADSYLARGKLTFLRRDRKGQEVYCLSHGQRVLYYLKTKSGSDLSLEPYRDQMVGVRGALRELAPKYGVDLVLISGIDVLSPQ